MGIARSATARAHLIGPRKQSKRDPAFLCVIPKWICCLGLPTTTLSSRPKRSAAERFVVAPAHVCGKPPSGCPIHCGFIAMSGPSRKARPLPPISLDRDSNRNTTLLFFLSSPQGICSPGLPTTTLPSRPKRSVAERPTVAPAPAHARSHPPPEGPQVSLLRPIPQCYQAGPRQPSPLLKGSS